jgi:hypothetical protein
MNRGRSCDNGVWPRQPAGAQSRKRPRRGVGSMRSVANRGCQGRGGRGHLGPVFEDSG